MILKHFLLAVNETNCYLAACREAKEAIVIDPGESSPEIDAAIKGGGFHLKYIAITHDHFDHTGGIRSLIDRFGGTLVSRSGSISGVKGHPVSAGDNLSVGTLQFLVLETPGHTSDSISLAVEDVIFTGDALFAGSVGGTASQANFDEEIRSIKNRILSHPRRTRVFPGHGPPSTVEVETIFNPFL